MTFHSYILLLITCGPETRWAPSQSPLLTAERCCHLTKIPRCKKRAWRRLTSSPLPHRIATAREVTVSPCVTAHRSPKKIKKKKSFACELSVISRISTALQERGHLFSFLFVPLVLACSPEAYWQRPRQHILRMPHDVRGWFFHSHRIFQMQKLADHTRLVCISTSCVFCVDNAIVPHLIPATQQFC